MPSSESLEPPNTLVTPKFADLDHSVDSVRIFGIFHERRRWENAIWLVLASQKCDFS